MKYIYGLNKSGKSIIRYLNNINEDFCCWDDDINIRNSISDLEKNLLFIKPNNLDYKLIRESFITPGISLEDNKLDILKKNEIVLYRDLELYSRIAKNKKIIAITGTNGKSTTTKLISDILNADNIVNFIGGNIGVPLLDFINKKIKTDYHVIELSSFQLESFKSFYPYISVLLNISKDHLDRYKNFKDYISQKEKIINLNGEGFNIICIDDQYTKAIYKKNEQKVIPISKKYLEKGIYYKEGYIIDNYFNPQIFTSLKEVSPSLFGNFNIENILAAYVVSKIINIKQNIFIDLIKNFIGLPHRLEMVYKNEHIQIINNSKATNIDATLKSISNYKNIFLILGGKIKDKNFSGILKYKNNITKIFLIGEAAHTIEKQLKKIIPCENLKNLNEVVKKIYLETNIHSKFHTVLFSPACSSFDQFSNFEERGVYFKKLINSLYNE